MKSERSDEEPVKPVPLGRCLECSQLVDAGNRVRCTFCDSGPFHEGRCLDLHVGG